MIRSLIWRVIGTNWVRLFVEIFNSAVCITNLLQIGLKNWLKHPED